MLKLVNKPFLGIICGLASEDEVDDVIEFLADSGDIILSCGISMLSYGPKDKLDLRLNEREDY